MMKPILGFCTKRKTRFTVAALVLVCSLAPVRAATFGAVVRLGGTAADIALDEARGVLYVANFGASRVDVVSLATRQAGTALPVAPYPSSLALSPDGRFLLVAHFGNFQAPSSPANALTEIDLTTGGQQRFDLGDTPLAVAFGSDGLALVTTTSDFLLLDPVSGGIQVLNTIAGVTDTTLPVPPATFPPQIVAASVAVSGDGRWIFGLTDTISFRYDALNHLVTSVSYSSVPPQGPRVVSVSQDGSYFTAGWGLFNASGLLLSQFANPSGQLNIGSHAVDSVSGVIYAQIPQAQQSGATGSVAVSPLMIVDADNLTVRDQLLLPENLTGRSILNKAHSTMYAVSESGIMILAVGSLQQTHRLAVSREDVLFLGNYCQEQASTQNVTIFDPGGRATDFTISAPSGILVSPSSGTTPANVRITVNPQFFASQTGTVAATLQLSSTSAVNIPPGLRVLINNRTPTQRGTIIDIPGSLVDILADPTRNRFYVLRQDKNEVLVFDGTSFQQIATLRTANTPTQMAVTFDQTTLLVGHDNSQFAYAYDLNSLQPRPPIAFPQGHYPRSIASSGDATLAASRVAGPVQTMDRVDLTTRTAFTPAALGPYENNININTALTASSNGASILAVMPDGTTMLYDSTADSFVASRQDYTVLAGSYAASNYGTFLVDNHLLDASLAPLGDFETATGSSSGFVFVDQTGIRTTVSTGPSPGTIERVDLSLVETVRPTATAEASLTGTAGFAFTRTLAALSNGNALVALTVSGVTAFAWNFDASVVPPFLKRVVNAADGTAAVAPGGLVTVQGTHLSLVNIATSEIPVPTALAESCLAINGVPVPMLLASPNQINAEIPFEVSGSATMVLHTPGGNSNPLNFTVLPTAPAVFRTGVAGPETGIPTVVRAKNNQLVTTANPIHRGDTIVIYATGLGATVPVTATGFAGSAAPLAVAAIAPDVTLGGLTLPLYYAGLAPGEVGVYQINALVPGWSPVGMQVPLTITQGAVSTTLSVRVID
jgi:uncharacterized protein (TIGR03437 family)